MCIILSEGNNSVPEFTVCSKSEVNKTVSRFEATHLVTLLDPDDSVFRPPRIEGRNHLRLSFEDVLDSKHPFAPTIEHCKFILDFGSRLNENARVVVHCHAGVSRSTAAALALWIQANGFDPSAAKDWLKQVRPVACPNVLMAKYFDQLLNLNGDFLDLCDKIGTEHLIKKFEL